MAGLFDQYNQAYGDEESPDVAQRIVGAVIDDDDVDEELAEAEKRLQKAQYYRVIVVNGVIEDDGSQDAAEVNAEARKWARQQMAKLLGVAQPEPVQKVELPFTPQQVAVLATLADKAMAAGLVGRPAPAPEPQVKKVQQPQGPQVRKVQVKPPQAKQKPPTETAVRPTKPAQPAQPAQQPAKKKPLKPQRTEEGEIDYDSIPTGEVFKDKDKALYKFVDNPRYDPGIEGSKPRTKMKVTNQVRAVGAIPMPQESQMSAITAAQAMETVSSGNSVSASSPFSPDENANQNTFVAAAVGALRSE